MAFKAFDDSKNDDDNSLPWTEEYVKTNPNDIGEVYDVMTVRLTQKGMMIATGVSKAFIYKSQKTYDHVVEFVEAWSGKKTPSPILQAKLTTSRPFVLLGVDDVRSGMWSVRTNDSWRQGYATPADNPSVTTNPLPLPTGCGDSVLSDDSAQDVGDAMGLVTQTSQDLPLEKPGSLVNGVKGRNTRRRG